MLTHRNIQAETKRGYRMTQLNIELNANNSKNNRIMVNGKDITKSVTGLAITTSKGKTPVVHLFVNDLAVLNVKGQINENVGDIMYAPKNAQQYVQSQNYSKFSKLGWIVPVLTGLVSGLVTTLVYFALSH